MGSNESMFKKHAAAFDANLAQMSRVSDDIKDFEKRLQEKLVFVEASYPLDPSQIVEAQVDDWEEASLAWSLDANHWRVMLRLKDEEGGVLEKPLVETKVVTRMYCYPFLELLLENIVKKLVRSWKNADTTTQS